MRIFLSVILGSPNQFTILETYFVKKGKVFVCPQLFLKPAIDNSISASRKFLVIALQKFNN
ncbi:hypothetical protein BSSX_p0050 (plasmid) [Bacillus subtilis]|nr:hypothetical protein BSSX_p0050 [Bacillus subtilis]